MTVEAEDHTTVTYTTTLGSAGKEDNNVGTLIPVFPTTVEAGATMVSGKAWAELDATNDMPEAATGAVVRATVSAETALGLYKPLVTPTYGAVETATYDGLIQKATVGADGSYSIIVPNGNGKTGDGFGFNVAFMPFTAKQKYVAMEDGKLVTMEKDVLFATGNTFAAHVDTDLSSVYAEIEAPTGEAKEFDVKAELVAQELFTSDFNVTNSGTGYVDGEKLEFSADKDGKKAELTINVDGNDEVTLTYVSNDAMYTEKPTITSKSAAGTGLTYEFDFMNEYQLTVDNVGTGYWELPGISLVYTDDEGTRAYDNLFSSGKSWFEISSSNGSGEVDNLTIRDGKVGQKGTQLESEGSVYTFKSSTEPVVNVNNPTAEMATISSVTISDGKITSISLDDAGIGYMTSPKVTLKNANGEAINAAAVATIRGASVSDIIVTNPGSGIMKEANVVEHEMLENVPLQNSASESETFKPGTTNVGINFNYGVGEVQ